jgi:hypothetical protein
MILIRRRKNKNRYWGAARFPDRTAAGPYHHHPLPFGGSGVKIHGCNRHHVPSGCIFSKFLQLVRMMLVWLYYVNSKMAAH